MKSLYDLLTRDLFWRAILDLALGLLMILAPNVIIGVFIYILAVFTSIHGFINITSFFRTGKKPEERVSLWVGLLLVVLGISMFPAVKFLASILPRFVGFLLMLLGFIQLATNLLVGHKVDAASLLLSIGIILAGMFAVVYPFTSMVVLLRSAGVVIIVMGAGELIHLKQNRPKE